MTIEDRPDNAPSLQLVLEGGLARLGEVPALDVARLIEGSIRAIARAAEMIAGREPGQVGRRGSATCLLYNSDAADERSSVDLGGRRIFKKKTRKKKKKKKK